MFSCSNERTGRWLRFFLGGGANTAFTYTVYVALNSMLAYQFAYFIAYALGIGFSYWFNAKFVFRVPLSLRGLVSYPVVYLAQYVLSALLLGILVEGVGIEETFAPLLVTVALVPITYLLSRTVLKPKVSAEGSP